MLAIDNEARVNRARPSGASPASPASRGSCRRVSESRVQTNVYLPHQHTPILLLLYVDTCARAPLSHAPKQVETRTCTPCTSFHSRYDAIRPKENCKLKYTKSIRVMSRCCRHVVTMLSPSGKLPTHFLLSSLEEQIRPDYREKKPSERSREQAKRGIRHRQA